jgi:hypothetical protein
MWHLEGKGSRRLAQHEGGSLLNRWHFSRTWLPKIVPDVVGRTPQHRLLQTGATAQVSPAKPPGTKPFDTKPLGTKPVGTKSPGTKSAVSPPRGTTAKNRTR